MPPSFSSPWASTPEKPIAWHRAQGDVPRHTIHFVHGLAPGPGLMQHIIQSIYHAIESDCRNAGITGYSPEAPDTHAAVLSFIRNRTGARANPVGGVGHDAGTTSGTRPTTPPAPHESAQLLEGTPRGGGRRGVGGSRKDNKTKKVK
jgi:hypothetical protein